MAITAEASLEKTMGYTLVMTFTVRELEHGPVERVDLPIEHGDFP